MSGTIRRPASCGRLSPPSHLMRSPPLPRAWWRSRAFGLKQFDLSIGYTVGYGTKDHSIYPYLAVVAGLYGEGRPVRLANDRYEQFQMGLKRHAFWMDTTLVVDRASGQFEILRGAYRSDGGGRRNFSPEVGAVGAAAGQGIYYFPKKRLLHRSPCLPWRRCRLNARLRHAANHERHGIAGG